MNYYVPTKDAIKEVFAGDKRYYDEAAALVEEWYRIEGIFFDDEESFLEEGYDDIEELADAATSEEERHIVFMALKGWDPCEYEDEDEDEDEDEEEEERDIAWIDLEDSDLYEDEGEEK